MLGVMWRTVGRNFSIVVLKMQPNEIIAFKNGYSPKKKKKMFSHISSKCNYNFKRFLLLLIHTCWDIDHLTIKQEKYYYIIIANPDCFLFDQKKKGLSNMNRYRMEL